MWRRLSRPMGSWRSPYGRLSPTTPGRPGLMCRRRPLDTPPRGPLRRGPSRHHPDLARLDHHGVAVQVRLGRAMDHLAAGGILAPVAGAFKLLIRRHPVHRTAAMAARRLQCADRPLRILDEDAPQCCQRASSRPALSCPGCGHGDPDRCLGLGVQYGCVVGLTTSHHDIRSTTRARPPCRLGRTRPRIRASSPM